MLLDIIIMKYLINTTLLRVKTFFHDKKKYFLLQNILKYAPHFKNKQKSPVIFFKRVSPVGNHIRRISIGIEMEKTHLFSALAGLVSRRLANICCCDPCLALIKHLHQQFSSIYSKFTCLKIKICQEKHS